MPPISRIASVSVTAALTVGLIAATEFAPRAAAEPCSPPEANVPPPAAAAAAPPGVVFSPTDQLPTGRMPAGANNGAPLPRLGPLVSRLLRPSSGTSAPLQQQAGVVPAAPDAAVDSQAAPEATADAGAASPTAPDAAGASPTAPDAAGAAPAAAAADPDAAIAGSTTSLVDWVTGPNSPNNTLERFRVSGTDLGIMWDNGDPVNRQVLMVFGDTTGYCSVHGHQWRYNTMFRSSDRNLADGISVSDGVRGNRYSGSPVWAPNLSKQLISSIKRAPEETSIIPTAGIAVGNIQYVNFMSVRQWRGHGDWTTNFSALAMSRDNGENWGIYPGTVRTPAPDSIPGAHFAAGNENFQQGAFLRGNDGYLYSFGTPAGRGGPAFVARVPENSVPDVTKYQYWHSGDDGASGWVTGDPAAATVVIPGPVGEMSVQYNSYLKQYLALYTNGGNNSVVARTAPAPQGPWSPEQTLVTQYQIPGGIYGPFLHPWSTGKDVYFTLSLWSAYNVMLMHTELA